jgi:hypothetical protein
LRRFNKTTVKLKYFTDCTPETRALSNDFSFIFALYVRNGIDPIAEKRKQGFAEKDQRQ